jgi:multidrug efflux pump subunit AcrB
VSFIGLFLTFYVFDFPFDQGGYASFILLGGLVVNAGIFIINDLKTYSKKYRSHNQALVRAIGNRSRTIILTTISTICGLIPFLIDGPEEVFWFSLSAGTIGGLVFSMFAIFVVLPVLLFDNKTEVLTSRA